MIIFIALGIITIAGAISFLFGLFSLLVFLPKNENENFRKKNIKLALKLIILGGLAALIGFGICDSALQGIGT